MDPKITAHLQDINTRYVILDNRRKILLEEAERINTQMAKLRAEYLRVQEGHMLDSEAEKIARDTAAEMSVGIEIAGADKFLVAPEGKLLEKIFPPQDQWRHARMPVVKFHHWKDAIAILKRGLTSE